MFYALDSEHFYYGEDGPNDQVYQSESFIQQENQVNHHTKVKQQTFTNRDLTNQQNQSDKLDYKNLPKMIGNNFEKYLEANLKQDPNNNNPRIQETKAVKQFLDDRKQNITNKKITKPKQVSTKISELRDFCAADRQSSKIFRQYIKKQLFIDLIQSPKVENPMKYIDGISIYYTTAKEPEKMISSKIKFSDSKKK